MTYHIAMAVSSSFVLNGELRQLVEETTREQGSANWLKARIGRVTSSSVKRVMSSSNLTQVAREIMSPRDISNLPYVARGIADEQKGVDYLRNELVKRGTRLRYN